LVGLLCGQAQQFVCLALLVKLYGPEHMTIIGWLAAAFSTFFN
jgi:hypothetical protein